MYKFIVILFLTLLISPVSNAETWYDLKQEVYEITDSGDYDKAIEFLEALGEQGWDEAYDMLGNFFDPGKEGNPLSSNMTSRFIERDSFASQYKNYEDAIKYYKLGSKLGNCHSQHKLAHFYEFGIVVEQNKELAANLYLKSAQQGHVLSQLFLGIMFLKEKGILQNNELGFYWVYKAARQGYPLAQSFAAQLLYSGKGVEKDYNLAFEMAEKSALGGEAWGQFFISQFYLQGIGAPKNYLMSYAWGNIMLSNSDNSENTLKDYAKETMDMLEDILSQNYIIEAQKLTEVLLRRIQNYDEDFHSKLARGEINHC